MRRCPIHLAFSLLPLGIAIWVNSLWLLAALVGAVVLIHYFAETRAETTASQAAVRATARALVEFLEASRR